MLFRDNTTFSYYLDCMCLPVIPGFVFINTKIVRNKGLDSFYAFWLTNRQKLKEFNYNIAIYDSNFNSMIEVQLEEMMKAYKSGNIDELIDPVKIPIFVNFKPGNNVNKKHKVSLKENRPLEIDVTGKSFMKINKFEDKSKILKNTAPLSIKLSTTTNSLYNQLSKLTRNTQQHIKSNYRKHRAK